jgi:protein TonB
MRSHLISSRVPIYPFTAELPGPVVIKVIITTRGTVRPIEVIAGDPTLRRAALDAVTTWHYDPWLVDGTPTDVTTTVTVDPPTDRP